MGQYDTFAPENKVVTMGILIKPVTNDKIEGTLVGQHTTTFPPNQFSDEPQDVIYYDLVDVTINGVKQPEGLHTIKANYRLEGAMKTLNPQPGWVIGIEYLGKTWKNKRNTMSDNWEVFGNPKHVDPDFRKKLAATDAPVDTVSALGGSAAPAAANPFAPKAVSDQPFLTPTELHNNICALLASKKGAKNEEEAKNMAMMMTNLPYLPANLEKIYQELVRQLGA